MIITPPHFLSYAYCMGENDDFFSFVATYSFGLLFRNWNHKDRKKYVKYANSIRDELKWIR